MAKNRDNFSEPVKRLLKDRVAHRCSNPSCRVPTISPRGKDNTNSIGIAAHICAASKGGPRYDEGMSVDQRKSIENAIWLCANCSIKIDKDVGKYPVELLHNWKAQAEKTSEEEMGQKLPEKNDAIDTLSAALTGSSMKFLSQAIANTHSASEKALESLDPRFNIISEYIHGTSSFELHPKENFKFSIGIKTDTSEDLKNKRKALIEHGHEFVISTGLLEAKGSKLIEHIIDSSGSGVLTISPAKIPAIYKIWLVNEKTKAHTYLQDIHGHIVCGTKSLKFSGTALDGMLTLDSVLNLDEMTKKFNLNIDFNYWNGCSIHKLRYFKKLFSFFEEVFNDSCLFTLLEADGEYELNGTLEDPSNLEEFQETHRLLLYIHYTREISSYLNEDIEFSLNETLTVEHFTRVYNIYKTIKGLHHFSAEKQTANAKAIVSIENAEKFKRIFLQPNLKGVTAQIPDMEREEIVLYGKHITMPIRIFTLENAIPKISQQDMKRLKDEDSVEIEFVPSKNYSCSVSYLDISE